MADGRVKIVRLGAADRLRHLASLRSLELEARYPLGTDSFRIDHGADYFAFFDRLGETSWYAAIDADCDEIAAVGCGVLRRMPTRGRAWYLCDLKVRRSHRGRRLPLAMFRRLFIPSYLRCRRGYAISMNPPEGPNRVVALAGRFPWTPLSVACELLLFSLAEAEAREHAPLIERLRGPISYLSLLGKKDLVLESTGRPLPLLHLQFGPFAERGLAAPQPGHVHMLCAPRGEALGLALTRAGVAPQATATLLHHGMGDEDWRFVLTSDL